MKTVLISGITGDLGLVAAECFAGAGWRVLGLCRTEDSKSTMERRFGANPAYLFIVADITVNEPDATLQKLIQSEPIHALLCLAGAISAGVRAEQTSADRIQTMMNNNLMTAWNLSRVVLPAMQLNPDGGAIITVASRSAAYQAEIGKSAYSASKAALIALTQTFAEENREYGIRANCIVPGIINTPKNAAWSNPEERRHWTEPEDIAQMMLFLASDTGKSITGALIPMMGV